MKTTERVNFGNSIIWIRLNKDSSRYDEVAVQGLV